MIIILDPGHGVNTPGKRSPDGSLLEYKYCREIQNLVCDKLESLGYTVVNTVLTDEDVSLSKRCKIANNFCNIYGNKNCLLVSIHCNAAGFGDKWMNASGWSVYISNNASSNSKKLAECLFNSAQKLGLKTRQPEPSQKYWT
jgi:N-acetylmuramoyl-L-alanine amidase